MGEKKDIKLISKKGVNFIRIGLNITEVDQIEEYIKYAKNQGLLIFIALMKADAINNKAKEYVRILQKLGEWGVDLITLMDSVGRMLPEDVKK